MILGIDEVGRGAWAGPLVVGAVVLGGSSIDGLTDSKILTKKRRELLCDEIITTASGTGLGWVWPDEIDEVGLGPALRLATKRAVKELRSPFHEIIIDGTINFLSDTTLASHVTTMKKADLLIPSVSAASIIAKVTRDRYMSQLAEQYPDYGFASHVGYGTALHRRAIETHGVTDLHRLSIQPLQQYRKQQRTAVSATNAAPSTTRQIGDESESAAVAELVRRGYAIVERNWKTKWCEIDIIAKRNNTYYFVEVKHRKTDNSGGGLEAITAAKLRQMSFAAELFVHARKLGSHDRQLMAVSTSGTPPTVSEVLPVS